MFGHHLLAYVEMLTCDTERIPNTHRRVSRLPLSAAALASTSYPIDREFVAQQFGSGDVYHNSLGATSDRNLVIKFYTATALIMTYVSRFSKELVPWMNPRMSFIDIAGRPYAGGSIIPQKKNPDTPELARGKAGRVNGHPIDLLMLMKGQPLAYSKGNQKDKEPLFDTMDTVIGTLHIFADMVSGITIEAGTMRAAVLQGYATATNLADYLVKCGLPFHGAYKTMAHAVHACNDLRCNLIGLSVVQLHDVYGLGDKTNLIGDDVHTVLMLEGSVTSCSYIGGTASKQAKQAIAFTRATPTE